MAEKKKLWRVTWDTFGGLGGREFFRSPHGATDRIVKLQDDVTVDPKSIVLHRVREK